MSGIPDRVRPHHWGFANAWLKSSFQRIPETIVSAIARAQSAEPVREAWKNFSKTLEKEDRLPADNLDASTFAVSTDDGEWYLAVVELPTPKHPQEAHYAILAVRPAEDALSPDQEGESRRDGTRLRYFLLERSIAASPTLVEWVDDERRELDAPGSQLTTANEQTIVRAIRDLLDD